MLLIGLTAIFVAAEFAIVKIRGSKIAELVETGDSRALAAHRVISNLDEYLSACQLGITITALGLGWLGEPTIQRLLHPVFSLIGMPSSITHIVTFIAAFIAVTYLHVVIGELAPKTISIQKAEAVSLWTAKPLILFYKVMYPFIKLLNGSAGFLVKLFGFHSVKEHEVVVSEEELRLILSESYKKVKSINLNSVTSIKYLNSITGSPEKSWCRAPKSPPSRLNSQLMKPYI